MAHPPRDSHSAGASAGVIIFTLFLLFAITAGGQYFSVARGADSPQITAKTENHAALKESAKTHKQILPHTQRKHK